ncbi:RNA polymerase sigma factor, sigma-70 family [Opitutaceae bacterium TAV1]|nr:RNA polymerase sigma factor, sigma-70 family [Opitutaceae bacterium TAV1]EIP99275.1 RNA polymerase sigma factor, sigma-70 family [Opitutaceae bacterium TAV1]
MDLTGASDEELVTRIRADDQQALLVLAGRYYVHLCQFSESLVGRHELAEEAASNVFIRLWQRRHSLEITAGVRSYLFGAVRKQSINIRLSQIRTADVPLHEMPEDLLVDDHRADGDLLYRELRGEIDALLEDMPEQRRTVFRMNRLENRRYKEIASLLGISVAAVQHQMVRASRQIDAALPRLRRLVARGPRNGQA